ncbi:hypothetical protein DVH05_028203 [Phytophthora capsici]|nr:hypothetical protein DVH05_028203 [Phytophthora capsici]
MTDLLTVVWTEYLRWELLPAYLVTVVLWVLTSSVRGVAWSLVTQVWLVVSLNSTMSVNFVTRYQEVLRDPELGQLSGTAYAFALWNAFFAVPVRHRYYKGRRGLATRIEWKGLRERRDLEFTKT